MRADFAVLASLMLPRVLGSGRGSIALLCAAHRRCVGTAHGPRVRSTAAFGPAVLIWPRLVRVDMHSSSIRPTSPASYLALCGMEPLLAAHLLSQYRGLQRRRSLFSAGGRRWSNQARWSDVFARSIVLGFYFRLPAYAASARWSSPLHGLSVAGVGPLISGSSSRCRPALGGDDPGKSLSEPSARQLRGMLAAACCSILLGSYAPRLEARRLGMGLSPVTQLVFLPGPRPAHSGDRRGSTCLRAGRCGHAVFYHHRRLVRIGAAVASAVAAPILSIASTLKHRKRRERVAQLSGFVRANR